MSKAINNLSNFVDSMEDKRQYKNQYDLDKVLLKEGDKLVQEYEQHKRKLAECLTKRNVLHKKTEDNELMIKELLAYLKAEKPKKSLTAEEEVEAMINGDITI
jgi:hypothetical protein